MTTRKSLVDKIKEDPQRAPGYYAAVLSRKVLGVLTKALESRPDMSISDIAEILGVTEDRVRWAYSLNDWDDIPEGVDPSDWNSGGNMRIASLARFLNVLGYELDIKAIAIDDKADDDYVNNHRERELQKRLARRQESRRWQENEAWTVANEQKSLVDEIREDPKEAPGFYAAELALNIQLLLQDCLMTRKDLDVSYVVDTLGVTEERVRWAYSLNDLDDIPEGVSYADWNSDGNLYVASLARFVHVLGYELDLKVRAIDEKANADYVNQELKRRRIEVA